MASIWGGQMTEAATIDTADEPPGDSDNFPIGLILALLGAVVGGLIVVGVAGALETSDDCSTYGYGGYNCVDYDDAIATVDPSTDLVDRQTVTITGQDFDPHFSTVAASQCDAALVEELRDRACDLRTTAYSYVDGNGDIGFPMVVRRIITTEVGGEIDCADEGACVIGVGTFEGFATPIEGVMLPIVFDPDVPPVPPLEVELTVDDVSADEVSGTVTCNRGASYNLELDLTQEKASRTAHAYGYVYDDLACDVTPTEWTAPLYPGGRRLVGGPATLAAHAYAWDGFDNAFAEVTEEVRLTGSPRPSAPQVDEQGAFTSIDIVGADVAGDGLRILVDLVCEQPAQYGSVNVDVSQWAGLDRVRGYGWVDLGGCDGTERVEVPVTPWDGLFAGGSADVQASVYVQSYGPGLTYFFDSAVTSSVVRLPGQVNAAMFNAEPDPDSRITIDEVTSTRIRGTIECEEPVMVDLSAGGVQRQGRDTVSAFGYPPTFDCDGTIPYEVDIAMYGDGLRNGPAAVSVDAYAYRIVEMDGYSYYEYVWDDMQQVGVRVRGSGR